MFLCTTYNDSNFGKLKNIEGNTLLLNIGPSKIL